MLMNPPGKNYSTSNHQITLADVYGAEGFRIHTHELELQ